MASSSKTAVEKSISTKTRSRVSRSKNWKTDWKSSSRPNRARKAYKPPLFNHPTFAVVNEYEGRIPFYHIDLYRLKEPSQLESIGFEEYIDSDGATVIEWAERAEDELPSEALNVYLSHVSETSREIGFLAE